MGCSDHFRLAVLCDLGPASRYWMRHLIGQRVGRCASFTRRERERHHRFLEDVAVDATRLAGERDWERILIAGDQRLIGPLVNALPNRLVRTWCATFGTSPRSTF